MRSMTGFGHAESRLEEMEIAVDARGVNSRYLDIKIHLARELLELEAPLKNEIQKAIARGRVDLFVEIRSPASRVLTLNQELLDGYQSLAERLRGLGLSGDLSLSQVLTLPGLVSETVPKVDDLREGVLEVAREALSRLNEGRAEEGRALGIDIEKRISSLEALLKGIAEGSARVREHAREKLHRKLGEISKDVDFDERRLAQEIAFYAERADISEELARLESHLSRFRDSIASTTQEPVGKSLDFLCQELNREINTILAKATLVDLAQLGVEAKAEIDRIREQVQNVE